MTRTPISDDKASAAAEGSVDVYVIATSAPAFASALVIAQPIPLPPPVIRTSLPL